MSSPHQYQSLTSPEPWQGEQPVPGQFQQAPPPQLYRQQGPPSPPRPNNGLAITALVVATVALLMGFAGFVSQMFAGILFGGIMSATDGFAPPDSRLTGTAPQVVSGQEYPGRGLENEITRIMHDDGLDVTRLSCPSTPEVTSGAVTDCQGFVDGAAWSFRATFEDGLGHFALDEKAN